MQRLKRKLHYSKEKSQENTATVVVAIPIVTILLLKVQIYTIKLLSFFPSNHTSKRYMPIVSIRWVLLQVLFLLHRMARTMQVEQLMPSEDSSNTIISEEASIKRSQPKLTKSKRLKLHKEWTSTKSGLLDSTDISTLDELTEEEKYLKRLLDFVDNETI